MSAVRDRAYRDGYQAAMRDIAWLLRTDPERVPAWVRDNSVKPDTAVTAAYPYDNDGR